VAPLFPIVPSLGPALSIFLALLNPRRDLHKRDSYSSRRAGMAVSPPNMYVSEYDHTGFSARETLIINLEDDPFYWVY
jgi:hypothetical protein